MHRTLTLCSNVAILIHRSQSISTWQVLKYNIENSTGLLVPLLHLNCSLTAEEGSRGGGAEGGVGAFGDVSIGPDTRLQNISENLFLKSWFCLLESHNSDFFKNMAVSNLFDKLVEEMG